MTANRLTTLFVGLFVLLGVAGVVLAAALLSGRTGNTVTYTTTYSSVAGIKYGTLVLYEGYRIGQVEEVIPRQTATGTTFRLVLSILEDWTIPEGSTAHLSAQGLLAAPSINIAGGPGPGVLAPGSEIPTGADGGMFAALGDVAGEVNSLSREGLRPLLDKLNRMVDALGGPMTTEIPAILANARATTDALAQRLPAVLERVETLTTRLETEVLSQDAVEDVHTAIGNLARFSEDLTSLGAGLRHSQTELDRTIRAVGGMVGAADPIVQASLRDLRHTLRTLATSVDAITFNLEGASRDMKEFSRSLRQNPGLLLRGQPPVDDAAE